MAKQEVSSLVSMLTCPVCRDIFREPQQLPCGHSMCRECLQRLMDLSDSPPRCPDCRAPFVPSVEISKCFSLSNIAEEYRAEKIIRDKQAQQVHCDLCPKQSTVAVKTCLKCEVSMCERHVTDHQRLPVFSGHPVVTSVGDLQERKCAEHEDAVLRYYCTSSRRYICNICALENRNLNVISEACSVLRRQLTEEMEQHLGTLQEKMKKCRGSVKKLHEEIQNNKKNPSDSWLNSVTVVLISLWIIVLYYAFTYSVENQILNDLLAKKELLLKSIYFGMAGTPTLNPDTANPILHVSPDLLSVERLPSKLQLRDEDSRFDVAPQVLSNRCVLAGTHHWEVEAEGHWDIAVSYQSIERKGQASTFGDNPLSWSLLHTHTGQLFAHHDQVKTAVLESLQSSRVAVTVHFEEGRIIFTSVGPKMVQLHEFRAELAQPVCLGLGLYGADPPSRASIVKTS